VIEAKAARDDERRAQKAAMSGRSSEENGAAVARSCFVVDSVELGTSGQVRANKDGAGQVIFAGIGPPSPDR
jgi:hypothetical protein